MEKQLLLLEVIRRIMKVTVSNLSLTQFLATPRNKCVISEAATPCCVGAMVASLLLSVNCCLEFGIYDIGFIQLRSVFWIPTEMWVYLTIGFVVKLLEFPVAPTVNASRDLVFLFKCRQVRGTSFTLSFLFLPSGRSQDVEILNKMFLEGLILFPL